MKAAKMLDDLPEYRPVGSRAEEHIIDEKISIKGQLKKMKDQRETRRSYLLIIFFVFGFFCCDVFSGGRITHALLVKADRWVHPDPYLLYEE